MNDLINEAVTKDLLYARYWYLWYMVYTMWYMWYMV